MLLQYDGLDTIGDFDDDYISVGRDDDHMNEQDTNTGELPLDSWLEADIMASDVRVGFTIEEQLVHNRCFLSPVTTTTDVMSNDYQEQNPAEEPEYVVGYYEKLHHLAMNLECMFNERLVKWLKPAADCRPVHFRQPIGCPGPWQVT
jgi:hypothetical protein